MNQIVIQDKQIKKESYDIFSMLLQGNTIDTFYVQKYNPVNVPNDSTLGLSKADVEFMNRQMHDPVIFKNVSSQFEKIIFPPNGPFRKNTSLTTKDSLMNNLSKVCLLNEFSIPVFSINRNKAFIVVSHHYKDGASGSAFLLYCYKQDNTWRLNKVVSSWDY